MDQTTNSALKYNQVLARIYPSNSKAIIKAIIFVEFARL